MFEGKCQATSSNNGCFSNFLWYKFSSTLLVSFAFVIIVFQMALAVQHVSSSVNTVTSHSSSSLRNSRPLTAGANRPMNTKFVVDWNNSSTSANKTKTNDDNLQEAFRRFREQRMVSLKGYLK